MSPLLQSTYWRDQDGETWELEAMLPSHRRNLLRWLHRNRARILVAAADDAFLRFATGGRSSIVDLDQVEWLLEAVEDDEAWAVLPLVRRLTALVAEDTTASAARAKELPV